MKKIVILTLAAAALSACGANRNNPTGAKEPEKPETSQTTESRRKEQMTGAYTNQRPLSDEEKELFKTATAKLLGVKYTPESVAVQIVAGTNYRFICTAQTVTREPRTYKAEVTVFKPLPGRGEAHVTDIKEL